ncbi:DNA topoisomerase IV, alpha subunit [Sodiomyces alkalinus F11]|uniref:DNA topoisomerase IV, alpha subunit n=1 Tax=Sodiomyces alkalinus (strain CBS 110278 / VKM F-3762 / F11) TaxID=1314773 RepID=A0A3N2PX28_SODAK|nr:DNA topoisomerase IV, alpha subunit [Sodiomyces alkalinus F11]ROT39024.1 DNA topoisomerase IV, alpha subunit [Sodiomyces alkalinus F11]
MSSTDIVEVGEARATEGNRLVVIAVIEDILSKVVDDISHDRQPSIPYRCRPRGARPGRPSTSVTSRTAVRFPGNSQDESLAFCSPRPRGSLLGEDCVVDRDATHQTKSQAVVDRVVDDLAYTLGFGRMDLNIVAAGKGLISGPIMIQLRRESGVLSASSGSNGVLVPLPSDVEKLDLGAARWLLVIEKEAVYRRLSAVQYWRNSAAGPGILVTGKGFPDLVTRGFLHLVQSVRPQLPIYCLTDFDPDGVGIMRCYKHGSRSLDHETHVVVPRLRWLGFKSSDLSHHLTALDESRRPSVTSPMSVRNRTRAAKLLATMDEESHDWEELECQRELQVMMFLGVKAEIQGVDGIGDVGDWLDAKLGQA